MYFGYDCATTNWGMVPGFTDEYNVPADLPAGYIISISTPGQSLLDNRSVSIFKPLSSGRVGMIQSIDGDVPADTLPSIGTILPGGLVLGEAVPAGIVPSNAVLTTVQIGVLPAWVGWVIVIALVTTMIVGYELMHMADAMTDAFKADRWYEYNERYNDFVAQFVAESSRDDVDIDGDGDIDYTTIYYNNGAIVQIAKTDEGIAEIGGTYVIVQQGAEVPDPADQYQSGLSDDKWVTYLIIGGIIILAIIILPKIISGIGSGGGGGTVAYTAVPKGQVLVER